ncbi:hypothetical protein BKA70DRAFT_1219758 [Coprinopsis sp. MPI-PUGE-AT-0042]|nr:hypothetical protein BKA70DRAFT_1219758 [Coprinopsis sp. MPI-PUGE-AT-0042]
MAIDSNSIDDDPAFDQAVHISELEYEIDRLTYELEDSTQGMLPTSAFGDATLTPPWCSFEDLPRKKQSSSDGHAVWPTRPKRVLESRSQRPCSQGYGYDGVDAEDGNERDRGDESRILPPKSIPLGAGYEP